MNLTGKIKGISRDWISQKWCITFEINECPTSEINDLNQVGILSIIVEKLKKKRSLTANAYFHVLSDKLAEKLKNSKPYQKNYLMHLYGQRELDENENQITLWVEENIPMLDRSDIHCEVVGYKGDFIKYGVLRPTHTYTSTEMAILIDGTVEDAKEQGIETLPPKQIERMVNAWKEHKK